MADAAIFCPMPAKNSELITWGITSRAKSQGEVLRDVVVGPSPLMPSTSLSVSFRLPSSFSWSISGFGRRGGVHLHLPQFLLQLVLALPCSFGSFVHRFHALQKHGYHGIVLPHLHDLFGSIERIGGDRGWCAWGGGCFCRFDARFDPVLDIHERIQGGERVRARCRACGNAVWFVLRLGPCPLAVAGVIDPFTGGHVGRELHVHDVEFHGVEFFFSFGRHLEIEV